MSYELIITEKPNAAKMIAEALADSKPIKESNQGVPYYKVTHGKNDIVIGCAVGHLYTVAEKEKSFSYPVFDLEWQESSQQEKSSFTKKYVSTLKKLAKQAKSFTVATDYDIEGEVIGLNCVRFICKQKDASRMKFSTLTKSDLIESYEKKSKTLDWGQANAGETRHYLDWMYGMNISRALTLAVRTSGMFKILSSGRVQGPALKLITDRENEIKQFKPEKYWQIELEGHLEKHKDKKIEFWHEKDKFTKEADALAVVAKTKGKNGAVKGLQKSAFIQKAPVPFDLTTLQTESYRFFGINPKATLDIAQELYSSGYISYPRTSSQKLPKEIGYKKIIDALARNDEYKHLAADILKTELKPTEGKKTDPAHPAIYPTGIMPKIADREKKVYDLIVKRFFACFAPDAKRETVTISVDIEKEIFIARGTRTVFTGWHKFYAPYVKLEEQEMPEVKEKDIFINTGVKKHDKETQPPKRYTPASIIRELEKQNLGTKATRATIIDSLYKRNYVKNESIEATELGIQTVETLEKYCPEILDAKLTRHFEKEMDKIREKKLTGDTVLKEARHELTKILEKFKKNEKAIGKELNASQKISLEQESIVGKCPKCESGTLKIMYSKKSKRKFIACDKYPDCKTIFNMPLFGKVQATEKVCDKCNHPIIKILAGRRTREICINNECPSKQTEDKKIQKQITNIENGKIEKICPKCGKNLVLRTSIYGQFLGCSGFPKCRHTERIESLGVQKKAESKNEPAKKDTAVKDHVKESGAREIVMSSAKQSKPKKAAKSTSRKKTVA